MDFDADSRADGSSYVVESVLPTKFLLLLPTLAGAGLCTLTASFPLNLANRGELYLVLGVFLAHFLVVLPPLIARRKATGKFLGFPIKTGMFLWVAAYAIGFSFLLYWPLLIPYL